MKDVTQKVFIEKFNVTPDIIVKGPGRINLIGEHTDYNMGFVLPAAISNAIYIAISKREDREIHLFSEEYNTSFIVNIDNLKPSKGWTSYILGVVSQFLKKGIILDGFNIALTSDLPIGAGVASSAALECAVAYALNSIYNLNLNRIALAQISQKAENDFVGVNCGIMDQFASLFGKRDQFIKLDCKSLVHTYYPLIMEDYSFVLLDTQVVHSLAHSQYNIRREECEKGVKLIRRKYKSVNSLRDTDINMIDECLAGNEILRRRCQFVVEENWRVNKACDFLADNDLASFGKLMNASHEGLSLKYNVSCEELDLLAKTAQEMPEVLGARMMGGGFGGCTLNLVKNSAIDTLINKVAEEYKTKMKLELKAYTVQIDDGTCILL